MNCSLVHAFMRASLRMLSTGRRVIALIETCIRSNPNSDPHPNPAQPDPQP